MKVIVCVFMGLMALGVALAGCAPNLEALGPLVDRLAQDRASACIAVWVGVGGGAIVPAPALPVGGGFGYVFLGRTNEPGSRLTVDNARCEIVHGRPSGTP